ncbi:MAG: PQQ-like beta-propeller repeat protein [Acidobacteria bacterium]|nr:PQQ-like beta-propeller repeat protein [Acidobacteriota bacterium]
MTHPTRCGVAIRVLLYAILCGAAPVCGKRVLAAENDWPQWRGPQGQGISLEKGLPTEWSGTQNVLWKTRIPGAGHSSPIIWGSRIFLTTSVEGAPVPGRRRLTHTDARGEPYIHPDSMGADHAYSLQVLCLDRDTGAILWQHVVYDGPVLDDRHRKNTYASCTPATDGRYVYFFFEAQGLYCFDFGGKLIWKASFPDWLKGGMGPGISPVLHGNLVILQCDRENGEGSFITALDKSTGHPVWKTERANRRSWATPVLISEGGRTELVASGAESVISYDPATGRELWRSKGVVSHPIPSIVAGHGMVFATAGSGAKVAMAIRLGGSGDINNTPHMVWEYQKGTAYVPSPILYGDYLYLMTEAGLLTCLDARTGEVKYEGGRVPVPASFKASPVAFEGMILLTSEDGDSFLIKAGPVHEVIRTNSLGELVWASPAISRGRIFIRTDRHLFCIGRTGERTGSRD